jgi:hypothetical protein
MNNELTAVLTALAASGSRVLVHYGQGEAIHGSDNGKIILDDLGRFHLEPRARAKPRAIHPDIVRIDCRRPNQWVTAYDKRRKKGAA